MERIPFRVSVLNFNLQNRLSPSLEGVLASPKTFALNTEALQTNSNSANHKVVSVAAESRDGL